MGFRNRLKLVRDETAPVERRVSALCNALTYSAAGYNDGMKELEARFGVVVGQPVSNAQLLKAAEFLENQWEAEGRGGTS